METPVLHWAAKHDRRDIAQLILETGCDPDIRSRDKHSGHETALFEAAFLGRREIAETLIKQGAKPNAKSKSNVTPLHEAARIGHIELCKLLLSYGADVNATDDKGETPLDWANEKGEVTEMVDLLRAHGGRGKAAAGPGERGR